MRSDDPDVLNLPRRLMLLQKAKTFRLDFFECFGFGQGVQKLPVWRLHVHAAPPRSMPPRSIPQWERAQAIVGSRRNHHL
jgi:hypothetical protein